MSAYQFIFTTILLLCLGTASCLKFQKEIKKSCTAQTDQGTVDLTPVAKSDGTSFPFSATEPGAGVSYWNPCSDLAGPSNGCKGMGTGEIFQISGGFQGCVMLSAAKDASFSTTNGALVLNYASPKEHSPSHITLKCSDTVPSSPFEENRCPDSQAGDNCFTLTHTVCCPKAKSGLSGGSILLIIAVVLLACYLIIGVILMKFVKKAEGAELIPNFEFWKSLPSLVKDGVMFIVRCGKPGNSGYSDI